MRPTVLDLFSGACGGWSLGLHRAGFETVAACEFDPWRRAVFAQNFPGVKLYDDVRSLTADRIVCDLGYFPDCVVGSPPCQDASAANTKGRGVDGERTGLYFEAVRIVREGRPRWCAFENVVGIRNRGIDRVLDALEALGYAFEPTVVGASDVGANHERKRSWVLAFDPAQVGCGGWRSRRHGPNGHGEAYPSSRFVGVVPNSDEARHQNGSLVAGIRQAQVADDGRSPGWGDARAAADAARDRRSRGWRWDGRWLDLSIAEGAGRAAAGYDLGDASRDGRGQGRARRRAEPVEGLSVETCGDVPVAVGDRQPDSAVDAEMGGRAGAGGIAAEPWADWNGGLASHLRLDDGLSARLAPTSGARARGRSEGRRIKPGNRDEQRVARKIVGAYGDAVLPQITEAIGRAILRTERALEVVRRA